MRLTGFRLGEMKASSNFHSGNVHQMRLETTYGNAKSVPRAYRSEIPNFQVATVLKTSGTAEEPWAVEQVNILTERLQGIENTNDISLLISIFFAALYTVFRIVVERVIKKISSVFRASFALILTVITLIVVVFATILRVINRCLVALLRLAIQATPAV